MPEPEQHEIPFQGRRIKNPRLRRGIFLLPSLFTVANLLCGYYAVVASLGSFDDPGIAPALLRAYRRLPRDTRAGVIQLLAGRRATSLSLLEAVGYAGELTQPESNSAKRADGVPFLRRKDIKNPTESLQYWSTQLPKAY